MPRGCFFSTITDNERDDLRIMRLRDISLQDYIHILDGWMEKKGL